MTRMAIEDRRVAGSAGDTPKSRLEAARIASVPTSAPTAAPTPARHNPSRITSQRTRPASAPSTIRMPLSRVRCATAWEITPKSPSAASPSPNAPKAVESNRGYGGHFRRSIQDATVRRSRLERIRTWRRNAPPFRKEQSEQKGFTEGAEAVLLLRTP